MSYYKIFSVIAIFGLIQSLICGILSIFYPNMIMFMWAGFGTFILGAFFKYDSIKEESGSQKLREVAEN